MIDDHRPAIRHDCPHDLTKLITDFWDQDRSKRRAFENVVNDMNSVVENVHQALPEDIEHVKSKRNKTEVKGMDVTTTSTNSTSRKKNESKKKKTNYNSVEISMDELD